MGAFLLRRSATSLVAVVGVVLLVFLLVHLIPGDPVDNMLGEGADPRDKAALRACLDLDQPLPVQLGRYLRDVAGGTLGHTCPRSDDRQAVTVASLIGQAWPHTVALALAALLVALLLALPLGVVAALWRGTLVDAAATVISLGGISLPGMMLGPLLLMLLYVQWRILPGPADEAGLAGLILPSLMLGTQLMAMLARMTRSSLLEVLGEDHVRTARAKGLTPLRVVVVHGLRNALAPIVTVAGIQFGALLAGAIVTEKVFARPGLGTLLLDGIGQRDYRIVQGCTLVTALSYVIVNLLVDLAYAGVDPRVRLGGSR